MALDKDIDYEKCMDELKLWWKAHPSLPNTVDDVVLKRFVHSAYGKVGYAKHVIELNYELRNKNPHIFLDRDPLSPETQKVFQVCDMIPLPVLTPKDNYRMIFYRLRDTNDAKFDFVESLKVFFMTADTRFTMENTISNGDVPIFDI